MPKDQTIDKVIKQIEERFPFLKWGLGSAIISEEDKMDILNEVKTNLEAVWEAGEAEGKREADMSNAINNSKLQ